jgi:pilus assembly protein FimV
MNFNPDAEEADAEIESAIEFDASDIELDTDELDSEEAESAIELEEPSVSTGFAETEELTIDSDLEKAAASISEEAAEVNAGIAPERTFEQEEDLAVETLVAAEQEPMDELELETAVQADEEFEFDDEGDSANTKLDLARAYIDMGDADGARDILTEVLDEGNSDQQQKAQSMLESL